MIKHTRSLAIAVAVIVNSLALATMHLAMGQIAEHERAALSAPTTSPSAYQHRRARGHAQTTTQKKRGAFRRPASDRCAASTCCR